MTNESVPHTGQDRRYEQTQRSFNSDMELLFEETGLRTAELKEAIWAITKGYDLPDVDDSVMRQAWTELANITENIVDAADDTMRDRLQVAVIVIKAQILLHAKGLSRYLDELDTAEVLAHDTGLDELSEILDAEISRQLESDSYEITPEILVVKLRGIVSEVNREFLRDLIADGGDMEDIITHAYNAILEEDGNPEEVLGKLGVLEDEN